MTPLSRVRTSHRARATVGHPGAQRQCRHRGLPPEGGSTRLPLATRRAMHDARSRRRSFPLVLLVLAMLAGALLARPAAAATLTIRWNDNAANETGYRIERRVT